ncbi:hypothetical protein BAC2_00559 [uncultured bacterium]|nr:hypothetical protein BAC2_00559 [uncultured bacterium]
MTANSSTPASPPEILRLKEAATYCRTSTDTLRRASLAGEIKLFRLGLGRKRGPLGVRREEVLRWLAAREAEMNGGPAENNPPPR